MKRNKVKSSNLISMGYDEDKELLEVEFKGNTVYQYFGVPKKVFKRLEKANSSATESLGSLFHKLIVKGAYVYQKMP